MGGGIEVNVVHGVFEGNFDLAPLAGRGGVGGKRGGGDGAEGGQAGGGGGGLSDEGAAIFCGHGEGGGGSPDGTAAGWDEGGDIAACSNDREEGCEE